MKDGWDGLQRAVLWDEIGEASWLGPEGCESVACDTTGELHVGYTTRIRNNVRSACMWRRNAEGFKSIHPEGYLGSAAMGIDGETPYGFGEKPDEDGDRGEARPILWTDGGATAKDLLPETDFSGGEINHAMQGIQVGYVWSEVGDIDFTQDEQACLWSGAAETACLLHPLLDQKFFNSRADAVMVSENKIQVLGTAWIGPSNELALAGRDVLWTYGLAN